MEGSTAREAPPATAAADLADRVVAKASKTAIAHEILDEVERLLAGRR